MRLTTLVLSLTLLAQSACIIVRPRYLPGPGPAPGVHGACPPGHVWSDGRCHDSGHGREKDHGHGRD